MSEIQFLEVKLAGFPELPFGSLVVEVKYLDRSYDNLSRRNAAAVRAR